VGVKADVIYYVPELSRHETSALGFAQQLRSGMWSLLAIPGHRPWSSLLDPAKRGAVEAFFGVPALAPVPGYSADHPLEVNIVVSVRTNHWRGRLIVNYEQMKAALVDLATTFPAELLKRTKTKTKSESGERTGERYVKLNYREHFPTTPLRETLELFAQADFVIGPHGAGTWLHFPYTAAIAAQISLLECPPPPPPPPPPPQGSYFWRPQGPEPTLLRYR
jgi:hypothetical protein